MPPEIKTRNNLRVQEAAGDEPVSPNGQYLNTSELSLCILAVLELEVSIDDTHATTRLQDDLLPVNPRFSSIMVTDGRGEKKWRRVEVKLQEHVITPVFPPSLSSELYDDYFNEYLTKIAADPLPQNRPLWEVHLFKYPTSKAAGHVIFKIHHSLGDGYTLMGTLLSCLQRVDDPSLPLTFPTFPSKLRSSISCVNMIKSIPKAICVAYNTVSDFGWSVLMSTVIEDSKTSIRSATENVEYRPMEIGTLEFSLDQLKEIKAALGVTINDVITSIVCYGVREYMQGKSENWASSHSTALVLLNTRNIDSYKTVSEMMGTKTGRKTLWGNQFAFLHFSVPEFSDSCDSLDPLKFVFQARRIIQKKKTSLAVYLIGQMLEIIKKCAGPEAAARFIHKTLRNSSLTITNVIGPVEKVALDAHPIKGLYFMVTGFPQSMVVSVLSYMQTLRISIGIEKDFINLQELKSCIWNAFEVVSNAATVGG